MTCYQTNLSYVLRHDHLERNALCQHHCTYAQTAERNKCKTVKPIYEPRHDRTTKVTVRPGKTQISLGIRPVWSESSLCAQWVAKGPRFLHADSEDSDQTRRMPRLIWVFAGRTFTVLVLSCRGSYLKLIPTITFTTGLSLWSPVNLATAISIKPRVEKTCLRGLRPG